MWSVLTLNRLLHLCGARVNHLNQMHLENKCVANPDKWPICLIHVYLNRLNLRILYCRAKTFCSSNKDAARYENVAIGNNKLSSMVADICRDRSTSKDQNMQQVLPQCSRAMFLKQGTDHSRPSQKWWWGYNELKCWGKKLSLTVLIKMVKSTSSTSIALRNIWGHSQQYY